MEMTFLVKIKSTLSNKSILYKQKTAHCTINANLPRYFSEKQSFFMNIQIIEMILTQF